MNRPLIVTVPNSLVRATLGELPDNVEIVEGDMSGPAPLARADMVIPPYLQSLEVLKSLEGLDVGLVQSLTLGYDGAAAVRELNRRLGT